jgi:large conductance mechanosensitive channel
MKIAQEFKEFIMRGSVIDLAIGIVIGAAFGRIVNSFVNDILMPPIGMLIGGLKFSDFKVILRDAVYQNGKLITDGVTINYGLFIQIILEFLIIAFFVFLLVKGINRMRRRQVTEPVPPIPVPPTRQEELLAEIRDLLGNRKTYTEAPAK